MRTDEYGELCPATLGEYRDLCAAFREDSAAVRLLDEKIAEGSRDDLVAVNDAQMRAVLMPMIVSV